MHPGPCDQVEDLYEPLVIEDREKWDGASIEDVRAHFRDAIFLKAYHSQGLSYDPHKEGTTPMTHYAQDPQSSICLVVDAEVLEWMADVEMLKRVIYGLSEEELRALPKDSRLYSSCTVPTMTGRIKGVDADWPRHKDIWSTGGNESSRLGAMEGIPDPPRPVSQYKGWKPVQFDSLWALYKDELRDGGRLGR